MTKGHSKDHSKGERCKGDLEFKTGCCRVGRVLYKKQLTPETDPTITNPLSGDGREDPTAGRICQSETKTNQRVSV